MRPRLLQHYVTIQAERRADAVAVVAADATLTYGELEAQSTRLARVLREFGCSQGSRVCVLAPKSAASIVAMLGAYKADCIYVPLDWASPAPRLLKMVHAARPSCILSTSGVAPLMDELMRDLPSRPSIAIGWLDTPPAPATQRHPAFDRTTISSALASPLPSRNEESDAAHLLFTSGSTGTPKGVVIAHANVIHFVEWAVRYFGITSADRQSCHSPLHFDLSVFDIFGTFAAGATLYLVTPELSVFPRRLAEFIRRHELTQWFSVPSLLTYMASLDVVTFDDFPSLKRLLWCGEPLATRTLMYWMRRLPHVSFTNLYGPTEATIASSYYTVPACPQSERDPIPIGTPCDGESLHVLDSDHRPVPPGTVGDLYIGGVGLSPGYWDDPDATQAAFIPAPPGVPAERLYRTGDLASLGVDGLFYFHGRADTQIKCRGHRIELGEIETALHTLSCVNDAAVVAIPATGFEGATICCAYVPAHAQHTTVPMLRQRLGALLPAYMMPMEWIALEALPKNANGKVDRPRLRDEFINRTANAPREHVAR